MPEYRLWFELLPVTQRSQATLNAHQGQHKSTQPNLFARLTAVPHARLNCALVFLLLAWVSQHAFSVLREQHQLHQTGPTSGLSAAEVGTRSILKMIFELQLKSDGLITLLCVFASLR